MLLDGVTSEIRWWFRIELGLVLMKVVPKVFAVAETKVSNKPMSK